MKEIFFLVLIIFFACCQNQNKVPDSFTNKFLTKEIIDSTIRQLEVVEWARASSQKDTQWLDAHIADELVLTTGRTGMVTNKQQTIDEIKDPLYGSGGSDKIEDLKIVSFENMAVATFKILTHGQDKTGAYFRIARYTELWIYRDDRWQLLSSHSSILPDLKSVSESHK